MLERPSGYHFEPSNFLGMGGGLLAGILGGGATVVIWKMSKTESPDRQMVYFTAISFIFGSVAFTEFGMR
jgi:hypothetical protein